MLVFISDYPNKQNEKDGMMQRIAAIDEVFKSHKRIYLDIFIHPFLHLIPSRSRHDENLTCWKVNFIWLLFFLPNILLSKMVYVHSIYNAYKILFLYKLIGNKIITDIHGVVPEELLFLGHADLAKKYNIIEELVVSTSYRIITVTDSMKRHFCNKYKNNEIESINLPIFDHEASKSQLTKRVDGDAYTILYSGGSQKWQNVDLMIESTSKLIHRFNFVFLTGDTNVFQSKLDEYSLNNNVELKSVEKNKVYEEYKKADFGFVLRDENTVNKVSCPTKLIEYLTCGLIPIVIQPEIGDFNELGYKYILLKDLLEKDLPADQEIEAMRLWNWNIIQNMSAEISESKKKLKQLALGKEQ